MKDDTQPKRPIGQVRELTKEEASTLPLPSY